jgi:predicted Zn-dependent protease with MMP-like domain
MDRKKFEELVKQGIDAIPERFLKKLDNVGIVVEDESSEEQIKKIKLGKYSKLFGLYEGMPQTKRGHYSGILPDKITIFKRPIEEVALNDEQIKAIVKNTVWHEIAHHFGMDEERVRRAERRK